MPEWRAALLAEAIRHTAHRAGPINASALFRHLQHWLGQIEEACGAEINTILFLMVRSGLYTSNTHDVENGTITFAGGTRLTPSCALTQCMQGGMEAEPEGKHEI